MMQPMIPNPAIKEIHAAGSKTCPFCVRYIKNKMCYMLHLKTYCVADDDNVEHNYISVHINT